MKLQSSILNKINAKAVGLVLAFVLCLAGVLMIFAGIKDDGFVDVKTPFLTGQARSGFVGLLLIFCATVITVCGILAPRGRHKLSIKEGDRLVTWEGSPGTTEEHALIRQILNPDKSDGTTT